MSTSTFTDRIACVHCGSTDRPEGDLPHLCMGALIDYLEANDGIQRTHEFDEISNLMTEFGFC